MIKKTKSQRFRELLPIVKELLESYTYDGVREVLKDNYQLDLTKGTFRSYLYREVISKETDSLLPKIDLSSENQPSDKTTLADKHNESSKSIESDNVETSDDDEIDYDALLEQFKSKHQTKSLLDKED